jgi:peroxiredoxin
MPAKKRPAKGSTTSHMSRTEREVHDAAKRATGGPADVAPSSALTPGSRAPQFTLRCTPDQSVSLSECLGRPVILAFYPADWSPVCGDQLALYNEVLSEFQRFGAELMGISVDGVWCHAAFAEQRHFHFPLLSDFEPKGEVARQYGVYSAQDGLSNRALFVVDRNGTIHWSYVSPMGVNPGADGILTALESLAATDGLHAEHSRPTDVERERRAP